MRAKKAFTTGEMNGSRVSRREEILASEIINPGESSQNRNTTWWDQSTQKKKDRKLYIGVLHQVSLHASWIQVQWDAETQSHHSQKCKESRRRPISRWFWSIRGSATTLLQRWKSDKLIHDAYSKKKNQCSRCGLHQDLHFLVLLSTFLFEL